MFYQPDLNYLVFGGQQAVYLSRYVDINGIEKAAKPTTTTTTTLKPYVPGSQEGGDQPGHNGGNDGSGSEPWGYTQGSAQIYGSGVLALIGVCVGVLLL
jgi:hypothetical protein